MQNLGPWSGVYKPDYQLLVYANGDPRIRITNVDWRSITRLATSKLLTETTGTFEITLKDARAREHVHAMDVIVIRLRGHNQGWNDVLRCVVDSTGPSEEATPTSAQQDTVITGRCTGKYLQSTSMFLPVWDPRANLPTALTFGLGDASSKLGHNVKASTPRQIFGYIYDHFVVGLRNRVGLSGIPNARFWLNKTKRFEWVKATNGKPFSVPFVQFDEDTCDTALARLAIAGYTEAWTDELGNIVYRPPGWDLPLSWSLHTSGLVADGLQDSDVGATTYVEVFPGAFPGVTSGVAQAMLAGRAPIPSDYVTGLKDAGFKSIASPEFIIDVGKNGEPTAKGQRNWYYQRQRRYGLRPYQITSPLLASREQGQAQAEGLLRQLLRLQKAGTVTIPGESAVRIGQTLHLWGSLRGQKISRTYYIEGVAHEYVEGDHYTTTLTLTHGRDPTDPHWVPIALPQFSASQLAEAPGILQPGGGGPRGQGSGLTVPFSGTPNSRGVINPIPGFTNLTYDMGIDADAPVGTPIYAPADCDLVLIHPNWSPPQPLMLLRFTPALPGAPTDLWYVSEQINIIQKQSYKRGDVVATFAASGTGIEIGWGALTGSFRYAQFHGNPNDTHFGSRKTGWGANFQDYFGI